MYKNDRTRKEILVDFGFRLPSALDNRPLTFEEFEATVHQAIYMSATPGPYELERSQRNVQQLIRPTGIVDPPITRPPDRRPDRRPARGDPGPRRARRARPGHDPDQEDGRGPGRLPARARGQGPVPPQRGRHARAGGDPARPAARRLRRAGRDQPAARGDRPARGHPGRDPRRRQGGLPALGLVADPDDRSGGPEHRRRGDHVRRQRDRVDAGRHRRDRTPSDVPGEAYNLEHGIEPTTIVKGIRDINERLRAVAETTDGVHVGARRRVHRGRPGARSRRWSAGWRPR